VPYYADMNPKGTRLAPYWREHPEARKRAAERLLALREALTNGHNAPPPRSLGTLMLATWNLREFDSESWGERLPESYEYIAEIADRFDLIALQEVRANLQALRALAFRLGPDWRFLVSDVTRGTAGNQERLAFLYDSRKVNFLGIAGELVLPPIEQKKKPGEKKRPPPIPAQQVARTPLMAAFQVGWTRFVMATVHIVYGDDSAEPVARVEEIKQVARFLRERTDDPKEHIRNFIALGDFNIFSDQDETMNALTKEGGFTVPEGVQHIPGTNVAKDKKYDQIAFRARGERFASTGRAGAFDYYEHVFTADDADTYRPDIDAYIKKRRDEGKKSPKQPATKAAEKTQFKTWRTYQMSDHLPLWAEFRVDFANEYLTDIAAG
jgi:endonuclease/exonuclease/phosphatase family metal-dependent hydrolase